MSPTREVGPVSATTKTPWRNTHRRLDGPWLDVLVIALEVLVVVSLTLLAVEFGW